MIKLLFLLSSLLFLSCGNTSSSYSPMLWEIKSKDLQKPSYIFGTFHTKDKDINKLSYVVSSSLKNTQRFYSEIKMTKRNILLITRYTKLSKPIILSKRLKPKTITSISKYLKYIGSSLTVKELSIFKTWAISLILANQEEQLTYPNRLLMDERLINIAKKAKIKQAGLETAIEQLYYFEKLTKKEQELLIIFSIKQATETKYKQALIKWYKNGKTKGFFEIQKKFSPKDSQLKLLEEKLNKGLLIERNDRFTRRIDILLHSKPELSYFFAVGAGHLVGEEGLLTKLKIKGYKVRKVHK